MDGDGGDDVRRVCVCVCVCVCVSVKHFTHFVSLSLSLRFLDSFCDRLFFFTVKSEQALQH